MGTENSTGLLSVMEAGSVSLFTNRKKERCSQQQTGMELLSPYLLRITTSSELVPMTKWRDRLALPLRKNLKFKLVSATFKPSTSPLTNFTRPGEGVQFGGTTSSGSP